MKLLHRFFPVIAISLAVLVIIALSVYLIANYQVILSIRSLPPEVLELLSLMPTQVDIDMTDNLTGVQCIFESISFRSPWGEIQDVVPIDNGADVLKFSNVSLSYIIRDNYVQTNYSPQDQEILVDLFGQEILESNWHLIHAAINVQPADMSLKNSIMTNNRTAILLHQFKRDLIAHGDIGVYEFDLGQLKAYLMLTPDTKLSQLHVFNQHGEHYSFLVSGAHQREIEQFLASLRFEP